MLPPKSHTDPPHERARAWMKRARSALAALLCAALLAPASSSRADADADELLEALGDVALYVETEVLVSGATRRVAKLSEAPGTIAVITAEELKERGVLTLAEAIRYVASTEFAPGTVALTGELRDIEESFNNKVLLLQDGRILNGVFRGNYSLDLTQPIESVTRLEIVRGPGSALYGANAFAGFINIITRKGDEVKGVEARLDLGSQELAHLALLTGGTRGARNWTVEARYASADGIDPVNGGSENSDQQEAALAVHLGKGGAKGETWFANVSFSDMKKGVPGTFEAPTPDDGEAETRLSLDGFRQWEPSKKTKLKLRSYYNLGHGDYDYRRSALDTGTISDSFLSTIGSLAYGTDLVRLPAAPNPGGEPDSPVNCVPCDEAVVHAPIGGTYADWQALVADGLPMVTDSVSSKESQWFTELQADWQVVKSNYLLGGVSIRLDDLDNDAVGSQGFENFAAFVEDEQRFMGGKLILLGSLRLDDHSYFGPTVSPRVSLIWSPNKKLIMKAAYGNAFRSPNFVELFGRIRTGAARLYGAQAAIEDGVIPEEFDRRICLDPSCLTFETETIDTNLRQEQIRTLELWTEYTPLKRLKLILNVYDFEITDEVGVALDRNDVYFLTDGGPTTWAIRPPFVDYDGDTIPDFTVPAPSLFAVPGLEDVPTLGVFLNAPDTTRGSGLEFEIHSNPWDWLQVDWNYSRRDNSKAIVGAFVERDDTSAVQSLVPTFSRREYSQDQTGGLLTFRHEKFWATLGLRLLGRPDVSVFSSGAGASSDLTLGWKVENFTLAGSVYNWNEGGTLYDLTRDDFVETPAEYRLTVAWRHEF